MRYLLMTILLLSPPWGQIPGACEHEERDSTRGRGFGGRGRYQRHERDPSGACGQGTETESWGPALLGTRGFIVSTAGRDEEAVRDHIRNQEQEDKRLNQMGLWQETTFGWLQ